MNLIAAHTPPTVEGALTPFINISDHGTGLAKARVTVRSIETGALAFIDMTYDELRALMADAAAKIEELIQRDVAHAEAHYSGEQVWNIVRAVVAKSRQADSSAVIDPVAVFEQVKHFIEAPVNQHNQLAMANTLDNFLAKIP